MPPFLRLIGTAAVLAAILPGCGGGDGPALYPVTGTIKFDGKTLTGVEVTFIPADGNGVVAMGRADDDGDVVMMTNGRAGVAEGKYQVAVAEPNRPISQQAIASRTPPPMSFPGKYAAAASSGLKFSVKPKDDDQTFAFVLEK